METMMADRARSAGADTRLLSLSRRLLFAGRSWYFFDRLFCGTALQRVARIGYSQTARIPDHAVRVAFDLLECARSRRVVPDIGNAELALLDADGPLPQHPRYRAYWYDDERHAAVGMLIGADLVRRDGRYYVLELNHGPTITKRQQLYDTPYDPIVTSLVAAAKENGFRKLVPIAFKWDDVLPAQLRQAAGEAGIEVVPTACPLERPNAPRMIALPDPLERDTMYIIHSGLMTPLCRYIDNKWYVWQWLGEAIERALPRETKVTMPRTSDSFFFPDEDHGERWPNLVVKLANSARAAGVIAGRFADEAEARAALGLTNGQRVPTQLRRGFANSLLFYGSDHILYQSFVPPELDDEQHSQLVRLHLLIAPFGKAFVSTHVRASKKAVPDRIPPGVIRRDGRIVFNASFFRRTPPAWEEELQEVAADLAAATRAAITRKFETSPRALIT